MRRVTSTILLAATVAASACATNAAARSPGSGSVITRSQIESLQEAQTVRQVVERLHPNWLHKRGIETTTGTDQIVVYWDRNRMGGLEALEYLRASDAGEIRFLSPAEATNRFGAGHLAGAIVISSRRADS